MSLYPFTIPKHIQFSTFQSTMTPDLDNGKLPAKVIQAFQVSGIEIEANASVKTDIPGEKWSFPGKMNGEDVALTLQMEPQYWEPDGEKIRFINSLDYLWNYR